MGLFNKKTDPISERARALSAEIAALDSRRITVIRASNNMNTTAKNAKDTKEIHCYSLSYLAHLAFLAVQIVRCS